jgi:hypothetical protein
LDEQANTSFSLSLSVNRLSGAIPASIRFLQSITVLKGNIFDCKYDAYGNNDGLPSHDQASNSYGCGSNAVNAALYVFAALCVLLSLLLLWWSWRVFHSYKSKEVQEVNWMCWGMCDTIRLWLSETWRTIHDLTEMSKQSLRDMDERLTVHSNGDKTVGIIAGFVQLNESLRQLAGFCTLCIVVIFMTAFSALSQSYSTYSQKYSYRLGFMFLSGTTPAIALLVLLVVFYILLKILVGRVMQRSLDSPEGTANVWPWSSFMFHNGSYRLSIGSQFKHWCLWIVYWFIPILVLFVSNAAVTLAVNTAYVYSETLDDLSDSALLAIALSISLFKVVWNNTVIFIAMPIYLHHFKRLLLTRLEEEEVQRAMQEKEERKRIQQTQTQGSPVGMKNEKANISPLNVSLMDGSYNEKFSELREEKRDTAQENDKDEEASKRAIQNSEAHRYNRQILLILLFISIFTNVLAPYISSFFFNPNCFYYTVSTIPAVTSSYSFTQCIRYQVFYNEAACSQYVELTRSMTYIPPFIYNYQCSSSLIQSFTAVYVYRYILSGIIWPLFLVSSHALHGYLQIRKQVTSGGFCGKLIDLIYWLLDTMLPLAWKVHIIGNTSRDGEADIADEGRGTIGGRVSELRSSRPKEADETNNPIVATNLSSSDAHSASTLSRAATNKPLQSLLLTQSQFPTLRRRLVQLFSRETFILRLSGEFAVLLTFGIVFPPLAIVICIAIVTQTLTIEIATARLMTLSKANQERWEGERAGSDMKVSEVSISKAASQVDMLLILFPSHFQSECHQMAEFISLVIPYVSVLMMLFLSFSLFDTMADSGGDMKGFIVMACLISIPVIEYFVKFVQRK